MSNRETKDDYSLERVPKTAKQNFWQVTVVRLGGFACVSQLMLGASLGYGMTFNKALLSVLLGSVILQIVGVALGIIAAREGLSTSLLSKWSGFGNLGSTIVGLIIAIGCIGWFGVQNSVCAEGMFNATKIFNAQIWAIITGLSIVAIVVYGFKMLSYTANIALPLFLLAVGIATVKMLSNTNISTLLTSTQPGPSMSLSVGTTMVAGGFIVGAVMTPDICRFLSNSKQVFWMILISTFVGELSMCMIAVLMAHAVKSSDIMTIMYSLSGWLGVAIVIFSTVKINDINLYSSSLGLTTVLSTIFKKKFNRSTITVVIGIFGTLLSAIGIMNYFVAYLTFLGVFVPPIAGIMVVDYFILKRDRTVLDEARQNGNLPDSCESWNPITIISWLCAFMVGYFVKQGISSLNSIITAVVTYYVLMKIYAAFKGQTNAKFAQTDKYIG
jgi:cytosine permease